MDNQNTHAHQIPFPDEIAHLAKTLDNLSEALARADEHVNQLDRDYMDAKRYMVQNRGEIDPHEMFQNELALIETDRSGALAVSARDRLAKLQSSPYFARINFQPNDAKTPAPYYIGRFAFSAGGQLHIVDWRAPIASMFYNSPLGPASYAAPGGHIAGNLTLKRQFKIKNGQMEYAFETSHNIQDEVLQRELSSTSDQKMKSIIDTIQKEQNQIIRNENPGTLIIQGVAGSGKTSIALHRVAYLLYRFKNRLSAQNITILSPNKVFANYISDVLPELGEEPIYETSFADIAEVQLESIIGFEPDKAEQGSPEWAKRVQYKSTLAFVKQLDGFIEQILEIAFAAGSYTYGSLSVSGEWISSRISAYKKFPLLQHLSMVAEDIHDRFASDNIMEDELPLQKTIFKNLKSMLKFKNTLSLYKHFYKQIQKPQMLFMPNSKTLEWNDVFPFLYLHAAFGGLQESRIIQHLVVDEMQDYTPIQYAVLNKLFNCQKTILGDFGQAINPNHSHRLQDLAQLYNGAELVELNTSYRSTYEIATFAGQIQNVPRLKAVKRHGPRPRVIPCQSGQMQLSQMHGLIAAFRKSGFNTLGIITKTPSEAQELYNSLHLPKDINLITPDSKVFENGISITCVQMSKGLEFDEVILPNADDITYQTQHDQSLLYVACTRAMHKLSVLHCGCKSPFLPSQ